MEDCFDDLFNRDHHAYPGVYSRRCALFLLCNHVVIQVLNIKMAMDQTR